MPGGDGTGPMGYGPLTGRGAGYCRGYGMPGFANPGPGMGRRFMGRRGLGMGFGRGLGHGWGRGWCRWALPYGTDGFYGDYCLGREDEKAVLTNEVQLLKNRLAQLDKRLREIGAETDKREDQD